VFVRNTLRPSVLGLTECHSLLTPYLPLTPYPPLILRPGHLRVEPWVSGKVIRGIAPERGIGAQVPGRQVAAGRGAPGLFQPVIRSGLIVVLLVLPSRLFVPGHIPVRTRVRVMAHDGVGVPPNDHRGLPVGRRIRIQAATRRKEPILLRPGWVARAEGGVLEERPHVRVVMRRVDVPGGRAARLQLPALRRRRIDRSGRVEAQDHSLRDPLLGRGNSWVEVAIFPPDADGVNHVRVAVLEAGLT